MAETPRLRDKLLVFYAAAKDIKNDVELARALGRAKSTLTGWVNGTNATPPDSIPDQNFVKITEVFNAQLGKLLSVAETIALWQGTLTNFMRSVMLPAPTAFDKVLEGNAQTLRVSYMAILHDALGMVEGAIDVPSDAISLCAKDAVTFEIDGRVDCCLLVLSEDQSGWRGLCPGKFHGGAIAKKPERFPVTPSVISFTNPLGFQRLVFIECPGNLQPALPKFGAGAPMSRADLASFADQLSHPPWAGKWRWSQFRFWVTETSRLEAGERSHT